MIPYQYHGLSAEEVVQQGYRMVGRIFNEVHWSKPDSMYKVALDLLEMCWPDWKEERLV